MNRSFFILLAVLATVGSSLDLRSASKSILHGERPLMSAYASKKGTVSLTPNYPGFKAQVDLEYDYSEASDSGYSSNTVNMLLGLYTSETVFIDGCGYFENFYCNWYSTCTPYSSSTRSFSLPNFNVSGYQLSVDAYLDYSSWSLDTRATLATSCPGNAYAYAGDNTYGIIGLGTYSTSYNFLNGETFSIYLQEDGSAGQLMFRSDMSYTSSSIYNAYLSADLNWHVSGVSYVYVGGYAKYTTGTSLIFDLNSNAIGLPDTIYTQVITYLSDYSVSCSSSSTDQPSCTYYGYIQSLPTISIYVGSQSIDLLPEIYVQDGKSTSYQSSITLNLRSLSTTGSGNNYVTADYANYIILGTPVMTYYYTVFNGNSDSIILYKASPPPSTTPSEALKWSLIIISVVVAFSCICCCSAKARSKRAGAVVVTAPVAPAAAVNSTANVTTSETVTVNLGNPVSSAVPQYTQPLYNGYQQPQPYGYGYPAAQPQQPAYGTVPNYNQGPYVAPPQNNYYS